MAEFVMCVTATKTAIVEAIRAAYDAAKTANDEGKKPYPRSISLEYPLKAVDWPSMLIQVRFSYIGWTGVMPDDERLEEAPADPALPWTRFREGRLEGFVDITILALSAEERDRMSDVLVALVLGGREDPHLSAYYTHLEDNGNGGGGELVGITSAEGELQPIGDSISQGVPWSDDVLAYEATWRYNIVGMFYMDMLTAHLAAVSDVTLAPYNLEAGEPVPDLGHPDGWQ